MEYLSCKSHRSLCTLFIIIRLGLYQSAIYMSLPKISYTLSVIAGVQIRLDSLVGSETRINPVRATRPMAAPQLPSSPSNDAPEPTMSPSMSEARMLEVLSSTDEHGDKVRPILYRSRDPSCTQHLNTELRDLILGFVPRNPFAPPEKLIHMVVEVPENVLSSVNCGPHVFPGVNSVGSSIHNVFLAQQHDANVEAVNVSEHKSAVVERQLNELSLSTDSTLARPSVSPPSPLPPTPLGSTIHTSYNVISLGEASLFLNLFPFAPGHAVVTNSESYYVSMSDFTLRQLRDSLCLCIEYVKACARVAWRGESYQSDKCKGGEGSGTITLDVSSALTVTEYDDKDTLTAPHRLVWPVLVWNYMPPSAGSIIHPHWQCFCEAGPSPMLARMMEAGERWMDTAHGPSWREEAPMVSCELEKESVDTVERTAAALPSNYAETVVAREFALFHSKEAAIEQSHGNVTLSSMLRSRYVGHVPVPGTGSAPMPVPSNSNVSGDTMSAGGCDIAACAEGEESDHTPDTEKVISDRVSCDVSVSSRVIPAGQHVFVVAPFAPRTANEVHIYILTLHRPLTVAATGAFGVVEGEIMDVARDCVDGNVADLSGLSPAQQHAYSLAMLAVIRCYDRMGIGAFNMTLFTGPVASLEEITGRDAQKGYYSQGTIPANVIDKIVEKNQETSMYLPARTIGRSFSMVAKFMSRPSPVSCYTNDTGPTERMMDTFVINITPEDYAQCMRDDWADVVSSIK